MSIKNIVPTEYKTTPNPFYQRNTVGFFLRGQAMTREGYMKSVKNIMKESYHVKDYAVNLSYNYHKKGKM